MTDTPRPFWNPLVAGVVLGLVLLATFLVTGHGLGASGFFTRAAAAIGVWIAPAATAANDYLGGYARSGAPLAGWITWEAIGLVLGALIGSLSSGRFRVGVEHGPGVRSTRRLALAFVGGILVGIGSRFARGCTSGLGLSGGAVLAVAGFVFLIFFFAAGFVTMRLMRRDWT
ncbi:MAG: transporter [Alphaproteobacteria bacterium]|nr:MAG: transporter [Alphaproteobacteria bacterium]